MKVVARFEEPDGMLLTITVSMQLQGWKRVYQAINKSEDRGSDPLWTLRESLKSAIDKAEGTIVSDTVHESKSY